MTVEVEVHTVPHFRATVNGEMELCWLDCPQKAQQCVTINSGQNIISFAKKR